MLHCGVPITPARGLAQLSISYAGQSASQSTQRVINQSRQSLTHTLSRSEQPLDRHKSRRRTKLRRRCRHIEMRRALAALQRTPTRLQAAPATSGVCSNAAWQPCGPQASSAAQAAQTNSCVCGIAQSLHLRGFAAHAAADRLAVPAPRPLPRPRRLGPPLGRAALPGHGQGSVNAAMAEAPPQYTVLLSTITAPYPKVR